MGLLLRLTTCACLFSIFLCFSATAGSDEVEKKSVPVKGVPSLVASVRFHAPLMFCGKKVPLDQQEVKERLEKEILLSLWDRAQVVLWLKRASRYFPHIQEILKKKGLPDDLKYVAVVESGLRAHAGSSKGAVGFWQFIRSTGRQYGLQVDSGIDERRSIFFSTQAACKYFKVLYARFNSWPLALAAYNMGEHGLEKEMKLQGNRDYFTLYLPLETQRYLFKILAARLIMENPEKYGFDLAPEDTYPPIVFDRVKLDSPARIPIQFIAQAAKTTFKEIKDMNPEIRGYSLAKGRTNVLIPQGRAKDFKKGFTSRMAKLIKKNRSKHHVVQKGENLSRIAGKYRISLASLLRWNHLTIKSFIHPGDKLVVSKD